jgi:hypothetical protein
VCAPGELAAEVRRLKVWAEASAETTQLVTESLHEKITDLERALSRENGRVLGRRFTRPVEVDHDEDEDP